MNMEERLDMRYKRIKRMLKDEAQRCMLRKMSKKSGKAWNGGLLVVMTVENRVGTRKMKENEIVKECTHPQQIYDFLDQLRTLSILHHLQYGISSKIFS